MRGVTKTQGHEGREEKSFAEETQFASERLGALYALQRGFGGIKAIGKAAERREASAPKAACDRSIASGSSVNVTVWEPSLALCTRPKQPPEPQPICRRQRLAKPCNNDCF